MCGEVSLGEMEKKKVNATVLSVKGKHSYNSFYCQRTCFLIEKYASVYGPTKALRKFKKIHPHLKFGESTVRALRAKYKSVLKDLAVLSTVEVLSKRKVGRPLLLVNEIDKKVQKKGVTKERWHCKQRSRHCHRKNFDWTKQIRTSQMYGFRKYWMSQESFSQDEIRKTSRNYWKTKNPW